VADHEHLNGSAVGEDATTHFQAFACVVVWVKREPIVWVLGSTLSIDKNDRSKQSKRSQDKASHVGAGGVWEGRKKGKGLLVTYDRFWVLKYAKAPCEDVF
jgi:hypothetical protein